MLNICAPRLAAIEPAMRESIIDKAVKRKERRLEGSAKASSVRLGELPAEDLIAIAVEENKPLGLSDVQALAAACDITARDLGDAQLALQVASSSP